MTMPLDPLTFFLSRRNGGYNERQLLGPLLLMYHGTVPGTRHPDSVYSVRASQFEAQLDLLQRHGWQTACIRDLAQPAALSPKTVFITFDDGYADNFSGAFHPLRRRNMQATWFIVSGRTSGLAEWAEGSPLERTLLSVDQLREMAAGGMEIGSHGHSHKDLTTLCPADIATELSTSKGWLEGLTGSGIVSVAYPFGRYNAQVVELVRAAGYQYACTTMAGRNNASFDPFLLRRITIFRDDTLSHFARKIMLASNKVSMTDLLRYVFHRGKRRLIP